MDEIKGTGGARIGMANATWPFATLIVNRNELQLKASIIGSLVFKPSDIVSIRPYTIIPLLGQGIKISHNVAGYNANVIFWTMGSPAALISRIEQTGFLTNTKPIPAEVDSNIIARQSSGGFPIKISAAVAIVLIWNVLLLQDFIKILNRGVKGSPLGVGSQMGLLFVFLTGLFLLISEPFRILILKPDRTIADIKGFVYFLMAITGAMFLLITFLPH